MQLSQREIVLLAHAIVIAPLILAYALLGDKKSPSFLRNLIITIAAVAIVYHSYLFIKIQINKKNKNKN